MPKEETIELRHIRNIVGEKEDSPSFNARSSLTGRVRSITLKALGIPYLIHESGSLEANETLTFGTNYDNVNATFIKGNYLYAGLTKSPAVIVKVDLSTYTVHSYLTFESGENIINKLYSDEEYLYAGLRTDPTQIVRINLNSFTRDSVLTLNIGEKDISALISDGSFLYASLQTTPGKVVKISLNSFTRDSVLTFAATNNNVRCLTMDGTSLYAGMWLSPGRIAKIDLKDFTVDSILTLDTGENTVRALYHIDYNIYALCQTSPGKIVKVNINTFTKTSTITFDAGDNTPTSLIFDGTFLHAGLYISPGKIVKVDVGTFTIVGSINFDTGENLIEEQCTDGTYIYSGLGTTPGKIVRIYAIPTFSLNDKRMELIDISLRSVISATTSNGNVGGTTLIDTARTEGNDYWNNLTLLILGGSYKGQSRKITDFDAASDTLTVSPAFNGQILSGVMYAILPTGSSSLLVTDILADSTPFNGADIPIIKSTNISMMEFNSEIDDIITLTTATANVALPDIVIADIPANTTIVRVIGSLSIHSITDTSGALNAINGAGMVQIQKSVGGVYTNLITIPDNLWRIQASTEIGGMIVRGTNDAASEVTANGTYNLKFNGNIFVDGNNLELSDVQVILKVYFIAI